MNTYVHKNRATSRRSREFYWQRRDVESNVVTLESNVATLQRGIFSTSRRWNPTSRR